MEKVINTINDIPIATNFIRVVYGGRGNYVEFSKEQLTPFKKNFSMPWNSKWRIKHPHAFYLEYRTTDGIKIYFQKKTVSYADYKIGMFYISLQDINMKGKI